MIINTVKLQANGYLVNGIISVPNAEGNRHFKMVKEWIAQGNTPDAKFTDTELLATTKINKKSEIKTAFETEAVADVEVNNISYNGGYDSALKLDAVKRMEEINSSDTVTFFDIDNKPNVLSIADATAVILTISAKYQTDFTKYQELKILIDSKLKVSTVEEIVW